MNLLFIVLNFILTPGRTATLGIKVKEHLDPGRPNEGGLKVAVTASESSCCHQTTVDCQYIY